MLFGSKFPRAFRAEHISYHQDEAEELALINYTSGTTGFSKGVMLPYRTIWSNVEFIISHIGKHVKPGDNLLSILPMAHMYGMAVEFLFGFCNGCHLFFLTRLPSPAIIAQAFADVKPTLIVTVPLIIEKIIRKKVFPKIQDNRIKLLLAMPVVSRKVKERIYQEVYNAFGGRAYEVIVGGAALSKEVEEFLHSINFPITVGYGTTECAPLISYSDYKDFVFGSCGTPVDRMEVKILSNNPQYVPGEIVTRGTNLMLGYYNNEEATKAVIDEDGWYHTGDLGTMALSGHIFIRGRIKNMLLGANGQNIYPEEIEDKLSSLPYVSECVVIQKGDKLYGLVYSDPDEVRKGGLSAEALNRQMDANLQELNTIIPVYARLTALKMGPEEFEKTPKKSIKRYKYMNYEV